MTRAAAAGLLVAIALGMPDPANAQCGRAVRGGPVVLACTAQDDGSRSRDAAGYNGGYAPQKADRSNGAAAPADGTGEQAPTPDLRTQWSVFSGYGFNQQINGSATGIDIATLGVRWTYLWPQKLSGLLRGHPSFGVEVVPVMSFLADGQTTWAPGANLLYAHHFAAGGRVRPIWKLGAGFLYADRELPRGETRHNFTLLTALGIDIMISPRRALFLGYRFHHVSNANSGNVNPGINAHTAVFGLSFYR